MMVQFRTCRPPILEVVIGCFTNKVLDTKSYVYHTRWIRRSNMLTACDNYNRRGAYLCPLDSIRPFLAHYSTWYLCLLLAAYKRKWGWAWYIIPHYLICSQFVVYTVLTPAAVWFPRRPECESKWTVVCPLPSSFLINVVSTYPSIAKTSAVHSISHILVDCARGNWYQVAVFLLTEDFSLVPGFLVGAPVVAAIIMPLPVVAAALVKKSF